MAWSRLLPAQVEILLAAGDVKAASRRRRAGRARRGPRRPLPDRGGRPRQGAVLLAEGDPRAALAELRRAWRAWQDLEVPYEAARVRVLIGLACRELGDQDGAEMELDAARWVFRQLAAAPTWPGGGAVRRGGRRRAG